MKKLLVVGDFISGSGLTNVIFNVFSRFPKNKYEISVVGYGLDNNGYTEEKCRKLGWKVYRVIPVTKNPIVHWVWWRRFFKTYHYDVVYFNYSSSWNYLPLVYAKKIGKTPVIVAHSHNSYFSHVFKQPLLNKMLVLLNNHGQAIFDKNSDIKFATSIEAAQWMFGEHHTHDVHISLNGINIENFRFSLKSRQNIRSRFGVNKQTVLVGFVGVLQKRKNPLFAIECFKHFHDFNPNSKMVMLGKGPLKPLLVKKIQEYNLSSSIKMIDFSPRINEWYSAMDVLFFPSLHEGLPLVTIEAQISNLSILASDTNPSRIFVTPNIKKMAKMNPKYWADQAKKLDFSNNKRDYFDHKLDPFSIRYQVKQIEAEIEKRLQLL